jgi:hypothetical protein
LLFREKENVASCSVADPDQGSGAFLTSGSGFGIGFFRISDSGFRIPVPGFRIPDLGSQTHIFESLVTILGVKINIILSKMAFVATKKVVELIYYPLIFCCCCWIRDPRSGIHDG